jgi:hypothetical protein
MVRFSLTVALFLILISGTCVFPSPQSNKWINAEVEISPSKFITVRQRNGIECENRTHIDDSIDRFIGEIVFGEGCTLLEIVWNEELVGGIVYDVPVSLMEFDGLLHVISLDRDNNRGVWKFNFYKQHNKSFQKIDGNEYPKNIAVQNMGLENDPQALERVLKLDPNNIHFESDVTARIWRQLLTGVKEFGVEEWIVKKDILMDFIDCYKPVRLTKIIKDRGYELRVHRKVGFSEVIRAQVESGKYKSNVFYLGPGLHHIEAGKMEYFCPITIGDEIMIYWSTDGKELKNKMVFDTRPYLDYTNQIRSLEIIFQGGKKWDLKVYDKRFENEDKREIVPKQHK